MSRFGLYNRPLTYLVIVVAIIAYINREALFGDAGDDVVITADQGETASQPHEQAPAILASEEVVAPLSVQEESSAPATTAAPIAASMEHDGSGAAQVNAAELWQQARAQVWSGNYEQAIEQYRQLVVLQPDNYDAHGELGDIYLGMRRYDEAGSSYLEAGRLLIDAGYARHAARLLPMLHDIAPERAAELQRLLWPQPAAVGRMP